MLAILGFFAVAKTTEIAPNQTVQDASAPAAIETNEAEKT